MRRALNLTGTLSGGRAAFTCGAPNSALAHAGLLGCAARMTP